MWNAGIRIAFLAHFFRCFSAIFFFPDSEKKSQKFSLAHREMWQKWVHILVQVGLWDKPCFFFIFLVLIRVVLQDQAMCTPTHQYIVQGLKHVKILEKKQYLHLKYV